MADSVASKLENTENTPKVDNGSESKEAAVVTAEVDESGDHKDAKTAEDNNGAKAADAVADADVEDASRKRKSVTTTDVDEEETKKAKTDDAELPATNGSSDLPEVTTKTVEDVKRLEDGEEVAA